MTELLFQVDSYLKSFTAQVVAVDEANHGLVLDRTAFYPGGGGQPPDGGELRWDRATALLKRVRRIDGQLVHLIDGAHPLPAIGSEVVGEIDWDRRYQLMRTHTAMHILCGVIFRDYGASVTGGNMDPLKGRMDFEFETMRKELVQEIEDAINVEVANARAVSTDILPAEKPSKSPISFGQRSTCYPRVSRRFE